MTANSKTTKYSRVPGTLDGLLPGESLDDFEKRVGDDIPEWTAADFARARPMREMFPDIVEAFERARAQRGPQKAPVKDRVGLRLDHSTVEYFRATGAGWQSRINEVLAEYVKQQGK